MKSFNLFIIYIFVFTLLSVKSNAQDSIIPPKIVVKFDVTSLQKLLLYPEDALKNADTFWNDETAYSLSKKWHDGNRLPIDLVAWKKDVEEYAKIPVGERTNSKLYSISEQLIKEETNFNENVIPYLLSFFPKDLLGFSITTYFTETSRTGGCQVDNQIVVDVSPEKAKDINSMLNTQVHELFHMAHRQIAFKIKEYELDNPKENYLINMLQGEGLATYCGYKAQSIYTFKDNYKYQMLENDSIITSLREHLNSFISKAGSLKQKQFYKMDDEIGFAKEAYYVFGAYMAKTIDEKFGRAALVNVVATGPLSFISTYNSAAEEKMTIIEYKPAKVIYLDQRIKKAYLANDYKLVDDIEKEILKDKSKLSNSAEDNFNSLGYYLVLGENRVADAIRVLELNVTLFPKSANAFDSLAEVYLKVGNKEMAIKNYKKSLELNPKNENAKNVLKEIENK